MSKTDNSGYKYGNSMDSWRKTRANALKNWALRVVNYCYIRC
jgi:hypothetical protein